MQRIFHIRFLFWALCLLFVLVFVSRTRMFNTKIFYIHYRWWHDFLLFFYYFIRSIFIFFFSSLSISSVNYFWILFRLNCALCILHQLYPIQKLALILISCTPDQCDFSIESFDFVFFPLLHEFSPDFHSVFIECNEAIVIAANVLGILSYVWFSIDTRLPNTHCIR